MESELSLLYNYLTVGTLVFGVGMVGFLARRNLIVMFLSAEMMLQGVSIDLVGWSRYHDNWDGQILVLFMIAVAACEAAIALALVLMLYHHAGNLDVAFWQGTREENLPAYVDQEIPEVSQPAPAWPELTPAGIEPAANIEELTHREHV